MRLNEQLRMLRQQQHLTLKEAARCSGVELSSLSAIERGRIVPDPETRRKLLNCYGVSEHHEDHTAVPGHMPSSLRDLLNDPSSPPLSPGEVRLLCRIEWRGRKPQTRKDWLDILETLRQHTPHLCQSKNNA